MTIEEAVSHATDTHACVIGENVLGRVPEILKGQFPGAAKALIVADPRTWKAAGEAVGSLLKVAGIETVRHILEPGGAEFHPEYKYVKEIKEVANSQLLTLTLNFSSLSRSARA